MGDRRAGDRVYLAQPGHAGDVAIELRSSSRGLGLADEAETVLRALRLLGMDAGSPEFPPVFRGCVVDAVEGFGSWLNGFRAVLSGLESRTDAREPVGVERLRVLY